MAFEELKRKQRIVWGTGPYERLPRHYAPLVHHLAKAVGVRPGEQVLDVACGTGVLASQLARSGARVTGIDLAPGMVRTARRLAAEQGLTIEYQIGDAERLPCPDAAFHVVVSSIGSMFAPDHRAVAAELARVCCPGGRLGLAHWSDRSGTAPGTGFISQGRT